MDNQNNQKNYINRWQDMEIGQDWSGLEEHLHLTGGNHYAEREEALRTAKSMRRDKEG